MSELILPGTIEFEETLATVLPYNWQEIAYSACGDYNFIARAGSGVLEAVHESEAREYLYGGEYDQRLEEAEDWTGDEPDEDFLRAIAPVLGVEADALLSR
ncbi:MAG: hypothetical protein SAJ12_10510 [Jaaginema sp. PMC 1079.18]|nr:hypothetical protein [Jaaginema sp. PMC 1080.18]MEC4851433.1 hypothetical protein [Jaaginema sp. PMC 1079.18]MEC4866097.1 hypothetical protein [Jaaginema sp. PMC 1078.18]